jgi:hypothetical protein
MADKRPLGSDTLETAAIAVRHPAEVDTAIRHLVSRGKDADTTGIRAFADAIHTQAERQLDAQIAAVGAAHGRQRDDHPS